MLANKKASYPIRWSSCFSTRPPTTATRSTSSPWLKPNWPTLIPITKDECFYNFKCLRPMSGLLPFNSVLSNISYVGAGFNAPSSPSCLAHASLLSPSCLSLITCLSLLTHSCLTLVSHLPLVFHSWLIWLDFHRRPLPRLCLAEKPEEKESPRRVSLLHYQTWVNKNLATEKN